MHLELRVDGETVVRMEVDAARLSRLLGGALTPLAPHPAKSTPLSKAQAAQLLADVDGKCAEFLKRVAESDGAITWGETKTLFKLDRWEDFVAGPGKAMLRAARHVSHDKSALLVWRVEHEWLGLEKGEDEVCMLRIDGPAAQALREAAGLA